MVLGSLLLKLTLNFEERVKHVDELYMSTGDSPYLV